MLDKAAIYHKSVRGAEAIATRTAALAPKQRSMLILINGKRRFEELVQLGQGLGDPELLMAQLQEQGLIEPEPSSAAAPPGPAPLPAGSSPAAAAEAARAARPPPLDPNQLGVPLPEARRFASRRLTDLLGPTGEDLCMRIENAKTPQDFRAAIRRTEAVLREVLGPEPALQFARDVENLRPA